MNNKMASKTQYYFLIITMYLFFLKNIFEDKVPLLGNVDEIFALLAIPTILFRKKIRTDFLTILVWFFFFIGVINSLLFNIQPFSVAAKDGLVCIKMWLSIYVGYGLFEDFDIKKYADRILMHLCILSTTILGFLIADAIFDLWPVGTRYGIRIFFLFGANGSVMVSGYLMLLLITFLITPYTKMAWIPEIVFMLAMILTLRFKAFGIVLLALVCQFIVITCKKRITLLKLSIPIGIVTILASPVIYFYYFGPLVSRSPRAQLTKVGIKIANDYFPFGTGFGTFASFFSGQYYSPLYAQYGIDNIQGMRPGETYFLSDSCWPILFGQFGWIGTGIFICAVISLFIKTQRVSLNENGKYLAGWVFLLALLVNSTAEPSFFNSVIVGSAFIYGISLTKVK